MKPDPSMRVENLPTNKIFLDQEKFGLASPVLVPTNLLKGCGSKTSKAISYLLQVFNGSSNQSEYLLHLTPTSSGIRLIYSARQKLKLRPEFNAIDAVSDWRQALVRLACRRFCLGTQSLHRPYYAGKVALPVIIPGGTNNPGSPPRADRIHQSPK